MRLAFKLAYLGANYHGYQIQPERRTVEHELLSGLDNLGLVTGRKESGYAAASRTDAGVHALCQVFAFNTDNEKLSMPRPINDQLPDDMWVWSRAQVPEDFDPRRDAASREYRYFLYGEELSMPKIRSASQLLKGTHDFANFTIKEEGDSTTRTVESVEVRVQGDFIVLDITADSFTRGMVRKIVTALNMIGDGTRTEEWLENMLQPGEFEEGIPPAPPEGLMLRDITYPGVTFTDDLYSRKRAAEMIQGKFLYHGAMAKVLGDIEESMSTLGGRSEVK